MERKLNHMANKQISELGTLSVRKGTVGDILALLDKCHSNHHKRDLL